MIERDLIAPLDMPDGLVRIIAALVNDIATPEREAVTLLNTAEPLDRAQSSRENQQPSGLQ